MRLREPYTFFVDRALGSKIVPGALRDAGLAVEIHDAYFRQDTPDTTWIPEVGKRGWVLLTKDPHIRSNQLERDTLLENRVAAFMLNRGDITGAQMAALFLKAHDPIFRALRRFHLAIIASLSVESIVTVLFADSQKLATPVRLAPRHGGRGE